MKQDRMKAGCECVLSFKKTEEGPKGDSEIFRVIAKAPNRSHGVGATLGHNCRLNTSSVSEEHQDLCSTILEPCEWLYYPTNLKGEHWVKEDYFETQDLRECALPGLILACEQLPLSFLCLPLEWEFGFIGSQLEIFALWWITVLPISDLDI